MKTKVVITKFDYETFEEVEKMEIEVDDIAGFEPGDHPDTPPPERKRSGLSRKRRRKIAKRRKNKSRIR